MIESSMRAFLLSRPGLANHVGERVTPSPLPLGSELPALCYLILDDLDDLDSAGPTCYGEARIQLESWAPTLQVARTLDQMVKGVLFGYQGPWPEGLRIGGAFIRGSWALADVETGLWRAITDYSIKYFKT